MGRLATVVAVERTDEGIDVKVDPDGGLPIHAVHVEPSGSDCPPLPGDVAALLESSETGVEQAVGYHDPNNDSVSKDGEVRRYARNQGGTVVCEFHLKQDGTVSIRSLAAGSVIELNGVTIDQQGNITTSGEVVAGATKVPLSTHTHPHPAGPTGVPFPGAAVEDPS